jgi:EAL domain-containing protein (putative c-di-GMP-specific phosphodiesterase class I)
MVRAIIGLARELNIEVMAQGVENEAQRDLLTAAPSTTKVQGFYYSVPVPAVHATELLRHGLIEPRLGQVSEATAAQ